jgi:membrane associated rhomboid family serine protease
MPDEAAPVDPPADDVLASSSRSSTVWRATFEQSSRLAPRCGSAGCPRKNWLGLVTYQFLHSGGCTCVQRLVPVACGCNLEDRWGRAAYLPFYLCAGIAALAHALYATPPCL